MCYYANMFGKRYESIWLAGLFAFFFVLYAVLPSAQGGVFASPDETAHVIVATRIAAQFDATAPEPLAREFSWLHPRSFVSVGAHMAPVGFLGWPFLLAPFRVIGAWLVPWAALFIFLSALWPFFQFAKRYGLEAAVVGTLIAFSFPAMILYGNRSLFSHTAVLAGALWSLWLIRKISHARSGNGWYALTGAVCALTASARPIELLWLFPWWMWAGRSLRPSREQWAAAAGGAGIVLLPLLLLAHAAYGSWFAVGYGMRDAAVPVLSAVSPFLSSPSSPLTHTWWAAYGLHPRTLVWNIWHFLVRLSWPWFAMTFAAVLILFPRNGWRRFVPRRMPIYLSLWTIIILLFLYGGGRYFDHIRSDAITIGNSFLRYLTPLALLLGLLCALLWRRLADRGLVPKKYAWAIVAFLVVSGIYGGYFMDDEGVWQTRTELMRYAHIRTEARQWFTSADLIVSARSDKIFTPAMRAVSPLPPAEELARFARQTGRRVGLFARPLAQIEKDAWRTYGFDVQELRAYGRERLYDLVLILP